MAPSGSATDAAGIAVRRTYRGEATLVSFDLDLCIHIVESLGRSPSGTSVENGVATTSG